MAAPLTFVGHAATTPAAGSLKPGAGSVVRTTSSASGSGSGSSGRAAISAAAAMLLVQCRRGRGHGGATRTRAAAAPGQVEVPPSTGLGVPEELQDISIAGRDVDTPHWSEKPLEDAQGGLTLEQLDWPNVHGLACASSGFLFLFELVRFCAGQPPSDFECYAAALIYAVIYSSRFDGIRTLAPHFRVTFYATTGWTVYYIAHLLAATNPVIFGHWVYPAGIVFLASSIYFYKHWIERMYRHYVEDRFRPYYVPGLVGLMYFHWLDTVDMLNQWLDPQYWEHVVVDLPDQAWTIADVRLTGLFMSSMALFMITLHNKGVLTGGKNTLITVLFTIFVPALFLTGTHATLQVFLCVLFKIQILTEISLSLCPA